MEYCSTIKGMKWWYMLHHEQTLRTLGQMKAADHKRLHILWFHYIKCPHRQTYRNKKQISGLKSGREKECGTTANGHRGFLQRETKCSKLDCGDGCRILWIYYKPVNELLTVYLWISFNISYNNKAVLLKKMKDVILHIYYWRNQ